MKLNSNSTLRFSAATLLFYLAACAYEPPRENHSPLPLVGENNDHTITSDAPHTISVTAPMLEDLSKIKLLIGYNYVRGNVFPEELIPNWSIRLKMSTSKSDFLSFDRGGMSFLLNAKRGQKQDDSLFRYTVTDATAVPVFGTPTLHTRCGIKPWVIYNTFALISSMDRKTILWAAHPSPSGERIVIVEPHNFNRFKCSNATHPV